MLLVGLFFAQAVFGVEFTSDKTSDYVNSWDGDMNWSPGRHKVMTGMDSSHDNDKEDRRYKFYYTETAGMSCDAGSWTDYKNTWDGYMSFTCGVNKALNAISSFHSNGSEDRLFKFKCCDISSGGRFSIHSVHTTNYLNDWDERIDATCNKNSVLVGLESYHSNGAEDRRWRLKCGIVQDKTTPIMVMPEPSLSGYLNGWDDSFMWTAPADRMIKNRNGICMDSPARDNNLVKTFTCMESNAHQHFSFNANTGEIKIARGLCLDAPDMGKSRGTHLRFVACDTNNANQRWEYNATTGLIKQSNGGLCLDAPHRNTKNERLHMWNCNENNPNQQWDMGTGGNKAIVGLQSTHDNDKEDRRWKAYTVTTPGVTCVPGGWTDYQNRWDEELDFTCPHNQIMSGFGGIHDNGKEDRRYRFRCCDVSSSGFHISYKRTTGRANRWDGNLDHACARNEVMIGLKSWHDNGKEDRINVLKCGTLTQNPPDFDDCTEVDIIDAEIGEPEMGERKTIAVNQFKQSFKACGNSIVPDAVTLTIESSKSVSKTESLKLSKSLEKSFSFSRTTEVQLKIGASVTAGVTSAAAKAEQTASLEFSLKTALTAKMGTTISSSEEMHTETGEVDVNVVSSQSVFEPAPYQWREAKASYIQQEIVVPLRMKAQCKRSDGKTTTLWIDSELKAAAYGQIDVDFVDRTNECPQSYYSNCECVTGLQSKHISREGCQAHPFMNAHQGCYVYKGNKCGNGRGLGTSKPLSNTFICPEASRCPDAESYYDYPLDQYVWEWSYIPCGGDRYYQGDPDYDGPEIEDTVWKREGKHCYHNGGGTLGSEPYTSRNAAIIACNAMNEANPQTCYGVYDSGCDNVGKFYLCNNAPLSNASGSCVWAMQDQSPLDQSPMDEHRRLEDTPVSEEPTSKTPFELFEEFGEDMMAEFTAQNPPEATAAPAP